MCGSKTKRNCQRLPRSTTSPPPPSSDPTCLAKSQTNTVVNVSKCILKYSQCLTEVRTPAWASKPMSTPSWRWTNELKNSRRSLSDSNALETPCHTSLAYLQKSLSTSSVSKSPQRSTTPNSTGYKRTRTTSSSFGIRSRFSDEPHTGAA